MPSEARARIKFRDDEIIEHFGRLGYKVSISDLAFTTETVDDFQNARLNHWFRAGRLVEYEPGILRVERAQPQSDQPTRDILVISLGHARVVMGVLKPAFLSNAICRYARAMTSESRSTATLLRGSTDNERN